MVLGVRAWVVSPAVSVAMLGVRPVDQLVVGGALLRHVPVDVVVDAIVDVVVVRAEWVRRGRRACALVGGCGPPMFRQRWLRRSVVSAQGAAASADDVGRVGPVTVAAVSAGRGVVVEPWVEVELVRTVLVARVEP